MMLLMPMAGEGKRFSDARYSIPKPFIQISGIPMFLRALECLPKTDKQVFIARREIPDDMLPPGAETIIVEQPTAGQASTCLLAEQYINNEEALLVAPCDNGLKYDIQKFEQLIAEADCIIFSFRKNPAVRLHPEQYGWVSTNGNDALSVSCKNPISKTPLEDHAITGAFWFAQGRYFVTAARKMIAENRRINNEFYVDECINDIIQAGLKVKVLEVDKYICWGTPNDLETYFYWRHYYQLKHA
jgi:dTDP-glucose pyrophosphorylase